MFEITGKDRNSRARTGALHTPHGIIETPAYVIVGTNAQVRTLSSADVKNTKTQVIIANTYHLWRELGDAGLENFSGLHNRMNWNGPIMTDSGGFQVFSLGFAREHKVGKIAPIFPDEGKAKIVIGHTDDDKKENLVRVTDNGVFFLEDEEELYLSPERSIGIQEKLGADIILAFDECTSPLHDYGYTELSLERTHKWAIKSLESKNRRDQLLFGIVQGGAFEDLRKRSAGFIDALPFDGFAIGGSLGKSKREMLDVLDWTVPFLSENKPRHLLGIGRIEDIFDSVERGIDMFDCVIPTREARHGAIWTKTGRIDLNKAVYANDGAVLEEKCECESCKSGISRAEIRALFKAKDLRAGRIATIHNVFFFNNLVGGIRNSIKNGNFLSFKNSFLCNPH